MKHTENREKFIYCLEGNWNKHPKSRQSIKPILDLLYTFSKVKYIYRKCSTKDEFIKGLQIFTQKRYSKYTVLYIAYHGRKNRICFGNEDITLKEIANVLEGNLNGKIVHFGSCLTLNTTEKNITDFITRTGCSLISGYQKNIEYIDSTAFDLLYFETIQHYYSYSKIKTIVSKKYSSLIEMLRFYTE